MKLGRNEKREIRKLFKMKKENRERLLRDMLTNYYSEMDCSFIGGSFAADPLLEYEARIFNITPDYEEIDKRVTYACM